MLSSVKTSARQSGHNHSVHNFRVFDQNGYSPIPITEESVDRQLVIYSMISIFNGLFSHLESVQYMMEQTDTLLSNSAVDLPIFFINSAELQRITQAWMFPHLDQKKSDPIKNAEKKWLDKFQRSETALRKEGKSFLHQILAWKSILGIPDYDAIYRFVKILLVPAERLEASYPDASSTLREQITSDIALLSPHTLEAVRTFAKHNAKRLQKETKDQSALDSEETDIDPSLYDYLATAFSVFLILAKLDTLQSIQEAFSLTFPISINSEHPVMPVLSYPISAAKDGLAEKTLSTFLKVQELYCKYSQQLGLPFIREKLTLIDSIVPKYGKKEKNPSRSPSPPDEKCTERMQSNHTSDTHDSRMKLPSVMPAQNELNHQSTLLTSSSYSTFYYQNMSSKIAQKIFNLFVKQHESNGSTSLRISYKNGITCDIVLLNEVSSIASRANEEEVRKMIGEAVTSVLDDEGDVSIEITFRFQSYSYRLIAERTKLECVATPK